MEIKGVSSIQYSFSMRTTAVNQGGGELPQTNPRTGASAGTAVNADGANPAGSTTSLAASTSGETTALTDLSEEEKALVKELKETDTEVRAHEQAHMAVGGQYARGGPSYEYQQGPDRRQYAVSGEVSMDMSSVPGSPEATIEKMQTIKQAALAPANPSAQDYRVAAEAQAKANQAKQEMARQLSRSGEGAEGAAVEAKGSLINILV